MSWLLLFCTAICTSTVCVAAQTPLVPHTDAPTPRLSVRPHKMATGIRTVQAGEQHLDSLPDFLVYVPAQCVGTRRVPLVFFPAVVKIREP